MRSTRGAICLATLLAVATQFGATPARASTAAARRVPFQRGVTIADWGAHAYAGKGYLKLMKSLRGLGVNTVTLLVDWRQNDKDSTQITPDSITANTKLLVRAIQIAHAAGLAVILKPYIDVRDTTGGIWRGDITPSSVSQWFSSYDAFILRYAKLAQAQHAQGFVVGTEMQSMSQYAQQWEALVHRVRKRFRTGFITYDANWGEEEFVKWWDAVDAIDVSAYYRLSTGDDYAVGDLVQAWSQTYSLLDSLHRTYNRPVMFGEIGYLPYTGTFSQPYSTTPKGSPSTTAQANGYTAAFKVWYPAPFFKGFEWWYVSANPALRATTSGNDEPRAPALKVLAHWYRHEKHG